MLTHRVVELMGVEAFFLAIYDVYTVHGNLEKACQALEIARREIARHYSMRSAPTACLELNPTLTRKLCRGC